MRNKADTKSRWENFLDLNFRDDKVVELRGIEVSEQVKEELLVGYPRKSMLMDYCRHCSGLQK